MQELAPGIQLLGTILERFDAVDDGLCGKTDRAADNCHISASYDGTSHFQSVAKDVVRIYKAVTGSSKIRMCFFILSGYYAVPKRNYFLLMLVFNFTCTFRNLGEDIDMSIDSEIKNE